MQIGCGLKADSCNILNGGIPVPTVCEQLTKQGVITVEKVVHRGFKDVQCVELGDPSGIEETTAFEHKRIFELLQQRGLFSTTKPDFVLYDVSGDQFRAMYHEQIRRLGGKRTFIVTTADFMSLSTANSIYATLEQSVESQVPVPFGGLIPNGVGSSFEESFIANFAQHTGTHMLGRIPRSLMVRQCELYGKTVIEASPLSNQSFFYRRLANQIVDESRTLSVKQQPSPMSQEKLRSWAHEWADRLFALENGLVTDGAAI
jgi:nitrogenase iron protein NifH